MDASLDDRANDQARQGDERVNDQANVLLLTYAELGDRLGIAPPAARLRAKRRGWVVEHGNDGRARVRVPSTDVPETPPERPRRDHDANMDASELLADAADARFAAAVATARLELVERAHAAEVAALRELVGELKMLLDRAQQPWWRRWRLVA